MGSRIRGLHQRGPESAKMHAMAIFYSLQSMDLHRSSYVDVFMLHAMAIAVGKLHVSSHTNEIEKE